MLLSFFGLFRAILNNIFSKKKKRSALTFKPGTNPDGCVFGTKDKTLQKVSSTKKNGNKKQKKKKLKNSWTVSQFKVSPAEGKVRFHDFELPVELMHSIYDLGFEYCSPIQAQILAHTLQGKDAIGKAQTGTGKTAAFLITIIALLLKIPPVNKRYLGEPRAIIVAPTRELALQIGKDAEALARYTSLNVVMLVGGVDYKQQQQQLEKGFVDIIIATPGRLLDFISKELIHPDLTEALVLDEADRMLDMGFIPQVRQIILATPRPGDRQTMFFSATFNDEVFRLAKQWTWNAVKVETESGDIVTKSVRQKIYIVSSKDKFLILRNLILRKNLTRVIVFVNRRSEARRLSTLLKKEKISCNFISGDLAQDKRVSTLESFRSGKTHVLVATDVAGRGIHVTGVTHVINYNLPENMDNYVHRVGRTGRAGEEGISIGFACEDDAFLIDEMEEKLKEMLEVSYPPEELL